jgi:hypothetical protein
MTAGGVATSRDGDATPVDGQVTTVPPLSGWCWLRTAGGETPSRIQWCGSQQ